MSGSKQENMQRAFDTALAHLRKQGRQSTDALGTCLYRGLDGTKCAVGVFIPDELYDKRMEGSLSRIVMEALPEWLRVMPEFLNSLQAMHDACFSKSFLEDLEEQAKDLAKSCGLTYEGPSPCP